MNSFKDIAQGYLKSSLSKEKLILTSFLSESQQAILNNTLRNKVDFDFHGGYAGSELKRCLINPSNISDFKIKCLKITTSDKSLEITHSNILGSIMALGLNKDILGDILANEKVFFLKEEILAFILENFSSIGHSPIVLEEVDGSEYKKSINLATKNYFVNSLRLDLVVSKIASISRAEAVSMISNSLVKVNHIEIINPTKKLKIDDVLSIRKSGRYILINDDKTSKKGNIILKVGKYI